MNGTLEIYRRDDGRWAWRLLAPNGRIVATDGSQGYEKRTDADRIATAVILGAYRRAKRVGGHP